MWAVCAGLWRSPVPGGCTRVPRAKIVLAMRTRLILIPGLGANRLLFEAQRRRFDTALFVPDWIEPLATSVEGGKKVPETLADYARRWSDRWAQTVLKDPAVRGDYAVGGVALGGQIALEAARHLTEEGLPPRGVFLIASGRTSGALTLAAGLGLRAGLALPDAWITKLLPRAAGWVSKREGLSELDARLLGKIAQAARVEFVRWAARAARGWRASPEDASRLVVRGVPIHQIHGDRDWVTPLRRGAGVRVVAGGRHLINITHADAVNDWIEQGLAHQERGVPGAGRAGDGPGRVSAAER